MKKDKGFVVKKIRDWGIFDKVVVTFEYYDNYLDAYDAYYSHCNSEATHLCDFLNFNTTDIQFNKIDGTILYQLTVSSGKKEVSFMSIWLNFIKLLRIKYLPTFVSQNK